MQDILNVVETVAELKKTVDETILNPPGGGDIGTGEDGKVVVQGITINTSTLTVETAPSTYTRDFTVEIKTTAAVGLNTFPDFASGCCAIMTFLTKDPAVTFTTSQLAMSNTTMKQMCRFATSPTTWSDWSEVTAKVDITKQIVESETEPTAQDAGDYWYQPIDQTV